MPSKECKKSILAYNDNPAFSQITTIPKKKIERNCAQLFMHGIFATFFFFPLRSYINTK